MKPQLPKGTKDFPIGKKIIKNYVVDTLKTTFETYGYSPIETPILEKFDVLSSKYAGGTEILKETFQLTDQGGRNIGLRYDLTVPLCRYMAMNPQLKMPFKRYQIGPVFRDGPIKIGRYRQFWQCDVDVVGASSMMAEAEQLALTQEAFNKIGLDVIIKVNNRKLLNGILEFIGIKKKDAESVILTIDKIEKIGIDEVKKELKKKGIEKKKIDKIIDIFKKNNLEEIKGQIDNEEGKQGIKELKDLLTFLKEMDVKIKVDISLARGLAYYTGTVFEVFLKDEKIKSSLAGGGRYNKMIQQFLNSKQEYPAVGISFGLDIICDVITKEEKQTVADVFIIPIFTQKESLKIAQMLRKGNIKTDIDVMERNISKNLNYANDKNIPFVIICGPDELEKSKVKLKDMKLGEERLIDIDNIVEVLKNRLKG